ncbi:MAG TPA: hypothetical protein DHV36_19440 [Desulfobacteraceae bacterium]|nr:hypothetical protein [Desulfobacteraceae bacterium]
MMNFSFFFMVTLGLIICQTVVFPEFTWFSQCFDTLIIVALYLSLAYSGYTAVAAIVVIGILMDSLSGGPFFLHVFSYLWVFLVVQMFKQFVFQRSALFMMTVSLIAVAIQQVLILFSVFVTHGQAGIASVDYSLVIRQLFWGVVFIPVGVWVTNVLRQNYVFIIRYMRREMARKYRG